MDSADEERVEIRGTALLSVTIQELRTKRPFLLLFVLRFVPSSPPFSFPFSFFLSPFFFPGTHFPSTLFSACSFVSRSERFHSAIVNYRVRRVYLFDEKEQL